MYGNVIYATPERELRGERSVVHALERDLGLARLYPGNSAVGIYERLLADAQATLDQLNGGS